MTWKWAPPTRYTFRRNTASTMKDLISDLIIFDIILQLRSNLHF